MFRFICFATSLLISSITAEFPLTDPCLQTCKNTELAATVLQQCIDKCMENGHCCGNRLNGEAPDTAAERLSCANGCEFAYYRSNVADCKADCAAGTGNGCEYQHPNIASMFQKCGVCQEGCDGWPSDDACSNGCDFASDFPEFYQFIEDAPGSCVQDERPRFLFAGQSNMVRYEISLSSFLSFLSCSLITSHDFSLPHRKAILSKLFQAHSER